MKLNLSKCTFGVSSAKFLGFMVSQRGIEANPDKIQVILSMELPKNVKEVPYWTSSRSQQVCLKGYCFPFFKLLRKAFESTDECEQTFEELKAYLTTAPLLSLSKPGEELYLYHAVSPHVVS